MNTQFIREVKLFINGMLVALCVSSCKPTPEKGSLTIDSFNLRFGPPVNVINPEGDSANHVTRVYQHGLDMNDENWMEKIGPDGGFVVHARHDASTMEFKELSLAFVDREVQRPGFDYPVSFGRLNHAVRTITGFTFASEEEMRSKKLLDISDNGYPGEAIRISEDLILLKTKTVYGRSKYGIARILGGNY